MRDPYPESPILIVDDERHFLSIARIALQMAGLDHVLTCSDSREVQPLLEGQTVAAVLLDLNMPHVSGVDILAWMSRNRPQVPVIVITASSDLETAAGCVGLGVFEYLVKPVDKNRLIGTLKRALSVHLSDNRSKLIRDLLLSSQFDTPRDAETRPGGSGTALVMKKTREAYQALFANMLVPLFIESAQECRLLYGNEALARFLGYPDSAGLAEARLSFFSFLDESDRSGFLARLRAHGLVRDQELHGSRGAGSRFSILLSCHLDESADQIEGSFIDITDRKSLEEQLLQAQKMEALGRMAGGIAHDFSNILAVISGCVELLQLNESLPDEVCSGLQEIRQAYQRGTDLTRQLLDFSRRQPARLAPFHLNALIREAETMLRRLLARNISLRFELEAERDLILAGPGQVEQVLLNLVLNARDAMPHGGMVRLGTDNTVLDADTARRYGIEKPGVFVQVRVGDTGLGMDGETMSKIFEPFFTTRGDAQGTGLGLSTVFAIMKNCGGAVTVQSEPGQGACFTLYLPLHGWVPED